MDFIIDTVGSRVSENNDTEKQLLKELFSDYTDSFVEKKQPDKKMKVENSLFNNIINDIKNEDRRRRKEKSLPMTANETNREDLNEVLKKSILTPEFEKLHSVPPFDVSKKKLREERRKEREKTKGKKWFGLPATEMTEEVKNDLEVLQMRSVLNPKHFYKKNDLKVLPKYFQIGQVMDSHLDFYNGRLTKKERKKTLVEELMADAKFNAYNKRKYKEIIEEKQKTHYKAWRQAKKLKKK